MTRILVTGGTTEADAALVVPVLRRVLGPIGSASILTGMAHGVDAAARKFAEDRGLPLFAHPLEPGPYPGPMHAYNRRLLGQDPHRVLAFKVRFSPDWMADHCINGTEHMCRIATRAGVPVWLNGERLSGTPR